MDTHICTRPPPDQKSSLEAEQRFRIAVPVKNMRAARLFVAMKMLEYLESKWRKVKSAREFKPGVVATPEIYGEILVRHFLRNGGWERARYLSTSKQFDRKIYRRRQIAKSVAQLIDFSLRVRLNPKRPRQKGGITMALEIVPDVEFNAVKRQTTTLKARWLDLAPVGGFVHLIYVQNAPLKPPRVSTTGFCEKLLEIVRRRSDLIDSFAKYNDLCTRLLERNYKFSKLSPPEPLPVSEVTVVPLPDEVQQTADRY